MKAAFFTGIQQIDIRQVVDLSPPDDGLVLSVKACGVCGSDLRRWKEGPPPGIKDLIAGHEIAGVVEAVGKDLLGYAQGDRVAIAPDVHCGTCYYCRNNLYNLCDNQKLVGITPGYPGGFAEQMILTAEILRNGIVHRMPEDMDYSEAALAEPFSSVLASQINACVGLRDTILVMGAGPIGCLHIAAARAQGARVILSEPSEGRRKMAEVFEPDLIVDPFNEDLAGKVAAFTEGLGVDIAVCANPIAATHNQAVELTRKGGRVILFGGLPKANPMTTLDANKIHYGEIQVVGAFSYHPTFHGLALNFLSRFPALAEKLITHRFDLENVNQAFDAAASGEALKVMIQ